MKIINKIYYIFAIFYLPLWADTLVVHNKTPYDLYAAVYYVKGDLVEKAKTQQEIEDTRIPSGSATFVPRPEFKMFYDRYLVVALSPETLTPFLTLKQLYESVYAEAGDTQGFEFLVVQESSKLLKIYPSKFVRIYNSSEEKPLSLKIQSTLEQVPDKLFSAISNLLKSVYEQYVKNPFAGKQAVVRHGTDISPSEKEVIKIRFSKAKKACENFLKRSLKDDQAPRIALCMSGGGYRSMIACLGFLIGLQERGLLDCTLYMAGLSGSTWLMAPWLESKKSLVNDYRALLMTKLMYDLVHGSIDTDEIKRALIRKLVFNQPLSLVDLYGALLAQKLLIGFGKDPQDIYLYNQSDYIKEGAYPYPIYTAIIPIQQYEWFEFTPHEAGSVYLESFVPSWALGRYFEQGKSVLSNEPPISLGFMMGICGSAFSANFHEILESFKKDIESRSPQLRELLYRTIANPVVGRRRISAASIYNSTFNDAAWPLNTFKTITLVDAGIECNVPVPPLLRKERAIDVIIVCDASKDLQGAPELKKAQDYAIKHHLPFPSISYEGIESKICSIFHDPSNPKAPVIIYMPMVHNPHYGEYNPASLLDDYLSTYNFIYTSEQIMKLSGLMEQNVADAIPAIKEVLEKVIEQKSKV